MRIGAVDCSRCKARGFYTFAIEGEPDQAFEWCEVCEHTGRVVLCRSHRGFFAVAVVQVDAFVGGHVDDGDERIVFLGVDAPPAHRYPSAGKRDPR